MSNYDLRDAFQELVALNEAEEFNLSDEEQIKKMADFMDGDEYDEVQMVIDVDAEGMDELEPSYEGKIILQCPVCKSLIYKDEADIVKDSSSDYVNVEEHCPYCKEEGGMIIVGKVAPYPTHEEEKIGEPAEDSAEEPVESEEETEVEIEEPVQESLTEEVGVQKFGDEDDPERYHSANWYIGGRNNFELSTDALGGAKRGDAVRYTASRWSHTYHNTQEMEDDIKNLQTLIAEVKKLEAKGFVNSELNESLKEDLTVDEQAKVNEIVDQFLRDACAEIAVRDIDYKKENILKAAQAFVDDFFFMSESLNEDVNGELAMAELKDLVAMHIYNRFLESFDDNMAQEIAHRIPEYDVDWCNEEGDNFLANTIETKKKALARAITDALFANAPRELPECLTESDMPAEESENIVYRDSRRNNFYLWRNGKRYEAETIEKLKEILKSKDEDCKSKELEEADVTLTEARSHKLDGFEVRISNRHPGGRGVPAFRSRYFGLTDLKDALALYRKSAQAQAKWEADSRLMIDDKPWGFVSLYGVYGPRSKEALFAEEEYADIPDGSTPGLDGWISEGQPVWPTYESEEDEVIKFADYLKQAVGVSESLEEAEEDVCPKCGKSPCECKECADTKLTEASEVIDQKGFATLIKYSDPVFANASHGVLNDGNFCYKFWAKDDEEAKKIFAERGVECDESLKEDSTANYIVCAYTDDNYDYVDSWAFLKKADLDYFQPEDLQKVGDAWCGEDEDLYWSFNAKDPAIKKFNKKDALKVCKLLDQTGTRGMYLLPISEKGLEARLEDEDLYEDLDTESLDKLISGKLGKIYVTESGYVDGKKIMLEGKLGKKRVSYVFEAKRGGNKVALIGEKFALKGRLENKNIICEDIADSFNEIADGLEEVAGQVRQAADNVEFEAEQVRVGAEEIEGNEKFEGLEEATKMSEIKGTTVRKAYKAAHADECLDEGKNPNFDEEKYGKYFTQDAKGNYKLIPEKADEYFALLGKLWKEQDDKEVNEAFFINPTSLDGYEHGCVIKDDDGEYKFVTSHDEAHPVALFDTKEAAEEVAKKLADQHTASKFPVVAESLLHEANLTEKKWEVRLESGKALRQAIDGEDGEEIKEALKNCYKEINRKMPEEFDEDELESMLDDLDMADFSENEEVGVDAEEAEDNVNAYLGDFYDFCDGYNIWVEI